MFVYGEYREIKNNFTKKDNSSNQVLFGMGKRFSCLRKNPNEYDVTEEEEEETQRQQRHLDEQIVQRDYSEQFQQYRRIDNDQDVQINQDIQDYHATTDEGTAEPSPGSTGQLLQDTASGWSGRMSTVSSNAIEPILHLPMITLTTIDDENIILEPGGQTTSGRTPRQHSDEVHVRRRIRPQNPESLSLLVFLICQKFVV